MTTPQVTLLVSVVGLIMSVAIMQVCMWVAKYNMRKRNLNSIRLVVQQKMGHPYTSAANDAIALSDEYKVDVLVECIDEGDFIAVYRNGKEVQVKYLTTKEPTALFTKSDSI